MQEAKLCSIHILKLSDGCAQGPEALAKFLSVANTLCVRSALQTVTCCLQCLADHLLSEYNHCTLWFSVFKEVHRENTWDRSWTSQLWERDSGKEMEERGWRKGESLKNLGSVDR